MCIYFGDRQDLTYKKREHVFPAGLGGIKKLSKGVVSDQANELFSPLELNLMGNSLISTDRMLFGPGSRGSLSPKRATKSNINVGLKDDGTLALCYIAEGKPYCIPQFHMHKSQVTVAMPDGDGDEGELFNCFITALGLFKDKYVHLQSEHIAPDEIIVGCSDKRYYVATSSERPSNEKVKSLISHFVNHFEMSGIEKSVHHTQQSFLIEENPDTARIYAKTAMNTLALLKGENYVCSRSFDEIREWIVTGGPNSKFVSLPYIQSKQPDGISKIVPEQAHWCVFINIDGYLEAIVCFYNHISRHFPIGKLPDETMFDTDGFICDWKNRQEYTLLQIINRFINQRSAF